MGVRYQAAPEPYSISDFPRALLEAVYTEGYNRDLDYPPEDETVQQALHRMGIMADIACAMSAANLSERETNVIVRRFMLGEDLIAIGQAYGVTRERVRQIEAKALRKLNHGNAKIILEIGMSAWLEGYTNDIRRQVEAAATQEAQREIEHFKIAWAEQHSEDSVNTSAEISIADAMSQVMNAPIEELDLSVRSYNCLKRRGLNTVRDIIDFVRETGEENWYSRIRNLGKKSATEVAQKVRSLTGIRIDTWEREEVGA